MPSIPRNQGFTLTELAISLVILGLMLGFFMGTGSAFINIRKTEGTQIKLRTIETALAGYVAINGRLPCPADGRISVSVANAGTEAGGVGGCTDNQQHGVVPWATLGLSEVDILDSWDNRITYRVGNNLWVASGMDMTACDPAGTEAAASTPKLCSTTCASGNLTACTPPNLFLQAGKGVSIKDSSAGNSLMDAATTPSGGAAYVLISHGQNGAGAYPANGATSVRSITGAGTDEAWNTNGVVLKAHYVDKDASFTTGTAYFDDLVLRPAILKVILQAQRGPRAH